MRRLINLPRFDKGLISDRNDVKGGLEVCNNVYPWNGGAEWRVRKGKAYTSTHGSLSLTGGTSQIHSLAGSSNNPNMVMGIATISSNPQFFAVSQSTGSGVLATQALDNTGSARTFSGRTNRFAMPAFGSSCAFGNEVFFANDRANIPTKSSGATGSVTAYTTGTVSGTAATKIITGSGTTWTSNHLGLYIWVNDTTISEKSYRITKIISTTSIEVEAPLATTFAAKNYRIDSIAPWTCKPGTFGAHGYTSTITANSTVEASVVVAHQGRVFGLGVTDVDNVTYRDRVRWSAALDEYTSHWGGADYWHSNAYLDVFPGEGGSTGLIGGASYNGDLYLFKRNAIYKLKGFLETDGTDVGASVSLVSNEHGLYKTTDQPIIDNDGVWFVSRTGLCVVNERGVTDFTEKTGVSKAFKKIIRQNGSTTHQHLSITPDQIIIQSTAPLGNAVGADQTIFEQPNTMVYWKEEGVWTTQSTVCTTRIITFIDGVSIAFGSTGESTANKPRTFRWDAEYEQSGAGTFYEEDRAGNDYRPLLDICTLPIRVSPVGKNVRIRGVHTRYYLSDTDLVNPSIQVNVIPGERDINNVNFIGDTAESLTELTDINLGDIVPETWGISRTNGGIDQYDSYRFRWKQNGFSGLVTIFEAGVDAIEVQRVR